MITVNFTDESTPGPSGPITGRLWDFGDGGTSTAQNPSHDYASAGLYSVTLTVTGTGADGQATTILPVVVVDLVSGPTASFTSSPSGLTVDFTDTSTPGSSGPLTARHWDFGDGNTSSSTNPSHTYASAGSYPVTLTVTGTGTDGTAIVSHTVNVSSAPPAPASFPSVLSVSGRSLVDAGGHVLPRLKGFNVQPAPWAASNYSDMYAKGARIIRTLVFWDQIEPSAGAIDSSYVTGKLDVHIARAAAAGLYNVLCLYYGPGGQHCPGWVGGSALGNYALHGQHVTEYLAKRYGDVADPLGAGKYTSSVIGMGINEPTPDSQNNGYLTAHLNEQKQMMTWFRAFAPDWIGFISAAYGPSAWLPNVSGSGHSGDQTFTGAPNDPFSGMGNWLVEAHCYFETTTDGETRTWDGRNAYGMPNGGAIIKADTSAYPPSGHTRAKCQASLAAFWAPYVAYCGSGHADVPLCVGEWGWKPALAGGDLYAADMAAAMANADAAIEMQWDYNTSTSSDPWAARPGGAWQTATDIWLAAA